MRSGAGIVEKIGERRIIVALGVLFLVAAGIRGYVRIATGTPPSSALFVSLFITLPGLVLVYGSYRLSETETHPDYYETVATWTVGTCGAMAAFLVVYHFVVEGGISNPDRAFPILCSFSTLAGFGLGLREGETATSKRAVEDTVEQLRASNERLEQFAYAASHDLQEPLRMVSTYLQLVESRADDELSDDNREYLAFAVDGADRMREMIDGLLVYSRVDSAGSSFESVDLTDVIEDATDDLQIAIGETSAEITVDGVPRVWGDERQLHQLFQNLLGNAIEYNTADHPQIRVSAAQNGADWTVSVCDNGIGIDPVDQDRIFEVFDRLHTRDEHPGTGIGLALCSRIVERHDGDIWVDSEPGEGSTFSVTLPAEPPRERIE